MWKCRIRLSYDAVPVRGPPDQIRRSLALAPPAMQHVLTNRRERERRGLAGRVRRLAGRCPLPRRTIIVTFPGIQLFTPEAVVYYP